MEVQQVGESGIGAEVDRSADPGWDETSSTASDGPVASPGWNTEPKPDCMLEPLFQMVRGVSHAKGVRPALIEDHLAPWQPSLARRATSGDEPASLG